MRIRPFVVTCASLALIAIAGQSPAVPARADDGSSALPMAPASAPGQVDSDEDLPFMVLTAQFRDLFPESFARAYFDQVGHVPTIHFKGDVPREAEELGSALPGLRLVGGDPYSRDEITVALLADLDAVNGTHGIAADGYYRDAQADYVLVVRRADGAVTRDADLGDANESLMARRSAAPAIPRHIIAGEGSLGEAWTAGLGLYRGGSFACSSAFPVKKAGGPEIGVLTAAHCPGGVTYSGGNDIFTVAPYSVSTGTGANGGEFRWLWSSQMFSGWTDTGDRLRSFVVAADAVPGGSACHFGLGSGYGCATTYTTEAYVTATVEPGLGGGSYRVGPMTCVNRRATLPGDSGGPWFTGSVALGIHFGTASSDIGTISCFSRATAALRQLGLNLWHA